jgi:hypothetical protein
MNTIKNKIKGGSSKTQEHKYSKTTHTSEEKSARMKTDSLNSKRVQISPEWTKAWSKSRSLLYALVIVSVCCSGYLLHALRRSFYSLRSLGVIGCSLGKQSMFSVCVHWTEQSTICYLLWPSRPLCAFDRPTRRTRYKGPKPRLAQGHNLHSHDPPEVVTTRLGPLARCSHDSRLARASLTPRWRLEWLSGEA